MFGDLLFIYSLFGSNIYADYLEEPEIYTLQNEQTYYLRAEYCDIVNSEFEMKGRCFSFSEDGSEYSEATSPGPTLKVIAGTSFNIILENNFVNSVTDETSEECHNEYCGMDVTNLHTHGLHISSSQDNVLVDLLPRTSAEAEANTHMYSYSILAEHYPGIHWYHPHNHGSVSHQIHFGMFGALITEYSDDTSYTAVGDTKLYTDGGETSYINNILVFSSVYAVNTTLCNGCSESLESMQIVDTSVSNGEGVGAYGRCDEHGKECFHQYSACYEYCAFVGTREGSGLDYDVEITGNNNDDDGIDHFILVNGQYNPELDITVGKFRRLQFVNTLTQYFVQYNLPPTDQCEIYLLGYDGVFFEDDFPRNLEQFQNELFLSPGGRADLLIKCSLSGVTYQVQTISNDRDFGRLERAGSDEADGIKQLFMISVTEDAGDILAELPQAIPAKPEYLKDLREEISVDDNCACNQFEGDNTFSADECCIVYNSKDAWNVNGEEFQTSSRFLTYLVQDRVYGFNLKTDRHVHHQHVYPFQLQEDIADGFIGKAGDYFDTLGADSETNIRIYTADFSGYMVLHCHLLPHEDVGMMGLFYVLSDTEAQGVNTPSPTESPTDYCLSDLYAGTALTETPPVEEEPPVQNGNAVTLDFESQYYKHNSLLILLVSIFIVVTMCNTVVIVYKHFITGDRTVRRQKYVSVIQKDIDEINDA